jgi:signal transduction histidine kinase
MRLLLVDDDERYLTALARVLRGEGFEVTTATSAGAALRELESKSFDAAISDYVMAESTGVELLRVIGERWPQVARVLVSGLLDEQVLARLIDRVGADASALKPVTVERLRETLAHALARARARSQRHTAKPGVSRVGPLPRSPRRRVRAHMASRARVLVVGPRTPEREALCGLLRADSVDTIATADVASAADRALTDACDAALIDLKGSVALELLERLDRTCPELEILMLIDEGSFELAVTAMRAGASDLVARSVEPGDLAARLERLIQRRVDRFSLALCEASKVISSAHDRATLSEEVTLLAARVMAADDASLMLPDGAGRLYVAFSSAKDFSPERVAPRPMGECIAGRVAALRDPVVLAGDLSADRRFTGVYSFGGQASSIVYPLFSGDRLLGVLNFNRSSQQAPFVERDLDRASHIAAQTVRTIENAREAHTIVATAKLAAVSELAASIVHEINNPLAYVLSNLDFARVGLSDLAALGLGAEAGSGAKAQLVQDEIGRALEDAERGAKRILGIVQDLRFVSRTDRDRFFVFDVNEPIRSALRLAGCKLQSHCRLDVRFGEGLWVRGNGGQLAQVVLNLLVNADEAMADAHSAKPEIFVESRREGGSVVISVRDCGPGISSGNQARMFEPFFTTKQARLAAGFGLSISREIIASHEGRIEVSSEPPCGAELRIVLPLAAPPIGVSVA